MRSEGETEWHCPRVLKQKLQLASRIHMYVTCASLVLFIRK
jgi:hypothetical protein